jgi:DNA-binding NtrC family response regulator
MTHSTTCPRQIAASASAAVQPAADDELPLKEACERFEREYVLRVVHRVQWNIAAAARVLRVHRNTILRKLSAWGLHRPDRDNAIP